MNTYKGFRDLDCYKYGRELRQSIAKIILQFPKDERYELTSQIKRSSRSVTANIAEGYGKYTYSDTRHFFIISRGSITETIEHLITAFDENYISDEEQLKNIRLIIDKTWKVPERIYCLFQTEHSPKEAGKGPAD
jgi:four helix bundle protein